MNACEAAGWTLSGKDHYLILGNRILREPIYEGNTYTPIINVGGNFYHVKYEQGELKVDYDSPVFVNEHLFIIDN